MQHERGSAAFTDEVHRYFPEWADRPDSAGLLLEADHNSYLAGGYSEEFGYRARAELTAVFPPLAGDPDDSGLWSVQIGGLHPGYPQCPRPHDRESLHCGLDLRSIRAEDVVWHQPGSRRSGQVFHPPARTIHVIRVGERARGPQRHDGMSTRLTSLLKRLRLGRGGLAR